MKHFFLFFCGWMLLVKGAMAQASDPITIDLKTLTNTHDIRLSPWGPYSKNYAGISHIPDMQAGLRFDISVVPSLYGSSLLIPNVLMQSGYYPWKANMDLTRYTYRYELEWKDQAYADVGYHVIDSTTTLVAMHLVNNTDLPKDMGVDLMAYVDYPENYAHQKVLSAREIVWKNAVDYQKLEFAHSRPTDHLPNNGWLKGEVRDSSYIDGRAVGSRFGRDKGDEISYQLSLPMQQLKGNLAICYRMNANTQGAFRLSGLVNESVTLKGTGSFIWKVIPYTVSASRAGAQSLQLESEGGSEILLNGILITPPGQQPESYVSVQKKNCVPQKSLDNAGKTLILKYPDIDTYYGIAWDEDYSMVREVKNDELDIFFRKQINDHVHTEFNGNNKGDYTDICLGPLCLDAHDEKTVYALLCTGNHDAVKKHLGDLSALKAAQAGSGTAANGKASNPILPEGKKYTGAWQLMKATLLTNIVYPIYTQNSFIRHFTPGKWWNSIYTWDLGFVALGLNEINPDLAAECINAYTTPVGSESAFILHGSPVPTQMYAFYDLWNKTQSEKLLSYFYPRLKQYYEFLVGRTKGSTTRMFQSDLLATWDYFYNSGGWDDYPPQVALHQQHAEKKIAPVITTAQCIRVAKMLRLAAKQLHEQKDLAMYDQDIHLFSNALQKYAWDSTSNYFDYVVHNQKGLPVGHFKYEDSVDYNMGLDGAYPLLSGMCTPKQEKVLLEKIFSPRHMWTRAGISVVDQSAPYYRADGYWNGTVWMPHQYFMWKTMLDLGRADLAFKIGQKALKVYKTEIDASYNAFEHFSARTGRGGGWHQFSGLSSPVLNWFAAYYRIGTVTPGFEIWIHSKVFNKAFTSFAADLSFDDATRAHARSLLICMDPYHDYKATFNGQAVKFDSPYPGLLQITLPATNKGGTLTVKSKTNK